VKRNHNFKYLIALSFAGYLNSLDSHERQLMLPLAAVQQLSNVGCWQQ